MDVDLDLKVSLSEIKNIKIVEIREPEYKLAIEKPYN